MKLILPDFCVERHVRLLEDLLDSLQITHLHTIKEILLQTTYPSPKIIKLLINAASLPKSHLPVILPCFGLRFHGILDAFRDK